MEYKNSCFGLLIEEWMRQCAATHNPATGEVIDTLCSAMAETGDSTPLHLLAAHCGYELVERKECHE